MYSKLMDNVGMYVRKEESSYWREWLREKGSRLLLFARQQTRRPEDAEDVLNERAVDLLAVAFLVHQRQHRVFHL